MSRELPATTVNDTTERKHEPDVFWARMVTSFGVGLLLLVVLTLIGIAVAFQVFMPDAMSTNAGIVWLEQNMDPGVEPNQAYGRERILAEEEWFLRQYSWEDKEHGIARIPIERGIDMMVERQMKVSWPSTQEETSPAESSHKGETP